MASESRKPNLQRLIAGGLLAGLLINAVEYLIHGVLLDSQWTAAFAVLGKKPTGWATYIPSNFVAGLFGVWIYTRFRPHYGPGPKTALRSALTIWVAFWIVPMAAIQPMNLFPDILLLTTVLVGLVDSIPAVLLGAWIYRPTTRAAATLPR